ncbi:roadblock/LC7 domain-containing protein [Streptomyces sp. NPDC048057]|uniref:roadblock/LC7 domain-containing protein n=1 Tax=Streptomyces sp. NPDC048057 TaxID=3155628 RepID=UPI0033CCBF0A
MPAEEDVLAELKGLRLRLPQLTGALAASTDGLVLGSDVGDPECAAALAVVALGVCVRLSEATGLGRFQDVLVRGERGYVATYAVGPSAALALTAGPRVDVDRLHREARASCVRLAKLVDGAALQPDGVSGAGRRRARRPRPRHPWS